MWINMGTWIDSQANYGNYPNYSSIYEAVKDLVEKMGLAKEKENTVRIVIGTWRSWAWKSTFLKRMVTLLWGTPSETCIDSDSACRITEWNVDYSHIYTKKGTIRKIRRGHLAKRAKALLQNLDTRFKIIWALRRVWETSDGLLYNEETLRNWFNDLPKIVASIVTPIEAQWPFSYIDPWYWRQKVEKENMRPMSIMGSQPVSTNWGVIFLDSTDAPSMEVALKQAKEKLSGTWVKLEVHRFNLTLSYEESMWWIFNRMDLDNLSDDEILNQIKFRLRETWVWTEELFVPVMTSDKYTQVTIDRDKISFKPKTARKLADLIVLWIKEITEESPENRELIDFLNTKGKEIIQHFKNMIPEEEPQTA